MMVIHPFWIVISYSSMPMICIKVGAAQRFSIFRRAIYRESIEIHSGLPSSNRLKGFGDGDAINPGGQV